MFVGILLIADDYTSKIIFYIGFAFMGFALIAIIISLLKYYVERRENERIPLIQDSYDV